MLTKCLDQNTTVNTVVQLGLHRVQVLVQKIATKFAVLDTSLQFPEWSKDIGVVDGPFLIIRTLEVIFAGGTSRLLRPAAWRCDRRVFMPLGALEINEE
jgi:hypothetical protein